MAENNQNQNPPQMQIKITDEILRGVYANAMYVMTTPDEFVVDFVNTFPPNGVVNSRVIVSPGHMKRIIAVLQDTMQKFESANGEVKAADAPSPKIGFEA